MTSRADIEAFFQSRAYAVIGVSSNRRKFGNAVFRTMKEKGFTVYPVHLVSETVEGEKCYLSVADLPPGVRIVNAWRWSSERAGTPRAVCSRRSRRTPCRSSLRGQMS